jgi:hypothetical protein
MQAWIRSLSDMNQKSAWIVGRQTTDTMNNPLLKQGMRVTYRQPYVTETTSATNTVKGGEK